MLPFISSLLCYLSSINYQLICMKIKITRNTRYRHSVRKNPLSRGKPSPTFSLFKSRWYNPRPFWATQIPPRITKSTPPSSIFFFPKSPSFNSLDVDSIHNFGSPSIEFLTCNYFRILAPRYSSRNLRILHICERYMTKSLILVSSFN